MQRTVKGKQLGIGDALRAPVAAGPTTIAGRAFGNPIAAIVAFTRMSGLDRLNLTNDAGLDTPLGTVTEKIGQLSAFGRVADRTQASIGSIRKQPTMPPPEAIGRNERQCWNS